ncbi:anti-sigma factor family protein [Desulfospira joergensenii]|uniref:anti-sigma factor family protein n=1 Tax=Desulfospira joergensenii TaxID=53329 RepID=UPI0003B39714|nr:zf-HC2 domain-containing protein [Desulfospira joergensenii]
MKCKDANGMMDAWIDGELAHEKRILFEHHLAECRTCSVKAEELRCLTGLLESRSPARPSPGLEKRTLDLFFKEAAPRAGLIFWWIALGWGAQTAMVLSALIGLVIGCQLGDGGIGIQQWAQYCEISGFFFSVGDLLISWA